MNRRAPLSRMSSLAQEDPAFAFLLDGEHEENALPTSSTQLVVYLSGTLDEVNARTIELAMTRSPETRALLREINIQLSQVQAKPLADLKRLAAAGEPESAVANDWLQILQWQLNTRPDPTEESYGTLVPDQAANRHLEKAADVWPSVIRLHHAGTLQALAFKASLRAITDQIRYSLRRTAPPLARGHSGTTRISARGLIDMQFEIHTCYIDADGELQCAATLTDHHGDQGEQFDGQMAHLHLLCGELSIPVCSTRIVGADATWTASGIGERIGILDAPLPVRYLSVEIEATLPDIDGPSSANGENGESDEPLRFALVQPGAKEQISILAPICNMDGTDTDAVPVEVYVSLGGSQIDEHYLELTLPPITRAAYPDHLVSIDLAVLPNRRQHLGAWPMELWSSAGGTFRTMYRDLGLTTGLRVEWLTFKLVPAHSRI